MHWTVGPATLSGGVTVSGSFVYDADTGTYSNVNISRSGGSLPAATFTNRQTTFTYNQSRALFFAAPVPGSFYGQHFFSVEAPAFSNTGGSLSMTGRMGEWANGRMGECYSSECIGLYIRAYGSVNFLGRVPGAPGSTLASIPTLSGWGLIFLSSLIAVAAIARTRGHSPNRRPTLPRI